MAVSEARRAANDRWDKGHMAYQTCKVPTALLSSFKEACAARGDKVNTVLRRAMEKYVEDTPNEITIAAMREAVEIENDPNVPGYTDVDALLADLKL